MNSILSPCSEGILLTSVRVGVIFWGCCSASPLQSVLFTNTVVTNPTTYRTNTGYEIQNIHSKHILLIKA
jgi:hypothetical protein